MIFEVGAAAGVVWHLVEDATKDYVKKTAKELVGKKIDEAVKAVKRQLVTELPKNGQLVRGLREDHLTALQRVLEKYRAELDRLPEADRRPDDVAFAERLGAWLNERLFPLSGKVDAEAVTEADVKRVLDHMVHPSAVEGFAPVARARSEAERAALDEIANVWGRKETLPDRFLACFRGRDKDGWYDDFALYVRKRLTSDDAFQRIFVAAEFVDIKDLLHAIGDDIDQVRRDVGQISGKLDDLLVMFARERDVPLKALQAQLARLGEVDVPEEQCLVKLEAFVTEFLTLKEHLGRKTNAEPEIADARQRALTLLEAGDLDGARAVFLATLVHVRERRQERAREVEPYRSRVRRALRGHYRDYFVSLPTRAVRAHGHAH